MKTILLTNRYPAGPLDIIKSVVPEGFRLLMLDEVSQEDLVSKASQADYILASGRLKINEDVLNAAPHVKMIQRTGVGLDSINLDLLRQRGISLYVNQGVNSSSVAEHTLLLMLSCLRRMPEIMANTKAGKWIKQAQGVKTHELKQQTIGIIGMGNIGQKVAQMVNAFGAKIICYSYPLLTPEQERDWNVKQVTLQELLQQSDIISFHCPLTDETRELVRKENLDKMKDGVIIVNTARGPLINETDLLSALESGKVSFAGLDVFNQEPPADYSLIQHPHVVSTPHIAGVTYDSFHSMMHDAMRNIALYDKGELAEIEIYKYPL